MDRQQTKTARTRRRNDRVERVQDLRRGSRTTPIRSDKTYDRNDWRNQKQAGYLDDEGWDE